MIGVGLLKRMIALVLEILGPSPHGRDGQLRCNSSRPAVGPVEPVQYFVTSTVFPFHPDPASDMKLDIMRAILATLAYEL